MKEISGDIPLSLFQKIQYLIFNFFRGIFGFRFNKVTHWNPKQIRDNSQDSLFRIYSNEFVKEVLPTLFDNKKISILDIGCGSGYIRAQLEAIGFTGTYEGVDVTKHLDFDKKSTDAFSNKFTLISAEEFQSFQKYDLVFSFTALEHVPDDAKAIKNVSNYVASDGLQVHIIPSFWSLFVYFFHGFRQYTKARIQKIFHGQRYTIYAPGGLGSFLVQILWFTVPERILKSWPLKRSHSSYQRAKQWALRVDKIIPFFPMQYIVIVSKKYDAKTI